MGIRTKPAMGRLAAGAQRGARVAGERLFLISTVGLVAGSRIAFERDTARAPAVAEDVLLQILRRNATSAYGERHGFAGIDSADAYRRQVPLIRYDDIAEEIDAMAHRGETNILTSDEVDYFMLTSGTSGTPKLIPTTKRERSRRIPALVFVPQGILLRELGPGAVMGKGMNGMSIAATDKSTDAGISISSSLRIGLGERTSVLRQLFTSPICAYEVRDVPTAYYLHWLFALAHRDLRYIADEFASKMAFGLSVLVDRHESLADDLERGRLTDEIEVSESVRSEVNAGLRSDPARAAQIRTAFAQGPRNVLPRLWPNLRYLAAITTGTFEVYAASLREFSGDLPIFNTTYGLSECSVAVSFGPDDPRYIVSPRVSFIEFIPEESVDDADPDTRLIDELQVGRRYEVVATNFAGLYRYRTADMVRVVGYHRRAPIIEFSHRANVLMNFNAEMMTEPAALAALQAAADQLGVIVRDYSIRPGLETFPPHYCFFVEIHGDLDDGQASELADALERELCRENPRYEDRVAMGRLLPARLRLMGPGGFHALDRQIGQGAQESGISVVQTKVPRLLKSDAHIAVLDSYTTGEFVARSSEDQNKGGSR